MSDIPSGALDAGESKAVSQLARVILPRPGEPLDVRKLYIEESATNARRGHARSRTALQIGAESEVSFSTYFNAFPASYWRRWSTLESVVLRAELTGTGRGDIYRTKATGARTFIEGRNFGGDGPCVLEFEVDLGPFEDGGWIWFDVTTDSAVTLHSAGWYAPVPAPGNRLSIHDQPNLGGSGGYTRVMYEALKNTDCQQILFMDDDIRIEPDSILRVLAMHRFARKPTLVGGQMLNLQEPS